jgi:hypothetical protein
VCDTLARPSDRLYGRAVDVYAGATVELTRLLVERSRDAGIAVNGAGSRVVLADTVVRDTLGQDGPGTLGHGLEVVLGATLEATAVLVERTAEVGVLVSDGAMLRASDLLVGDGTGRPLDGAGGSALYVQRSSTAELDRVVLEGNRAVGAAALSASSVVARDALLRTTREVCVTTGECGNGIGAGAYGDGNVTLTRFRIADNALIGLQLARGGTADLHQGEVTGNPIGVNVQTEGFELGRLEDGVVYRMNGRDLDSEALPIPDLELPP